MLQLGMLNDNRIINYRNLFSFLHYRFSKCAQVLHWLQQKARSGPCVNSLLIIIAHAGRFKPGSPPTQFTVFYCMRWSGRKLAGADTVHQWYFSFKIHFSFSFYKFFSQSFLFLYYISIDLNNYLSFCKFLHQSFLFYIISVLPETIISVLSSFD